MTNKDTHMKQTQNPTTLDAANSDPRVASAYRDSDGVWIELESGWGNFYDEPRGGLHGIHETSVRAALRALRGARPCDCADCVEGLHKTAQATALAALKRATAAVDAVLNARDDVPQADR